MSLFRGTIQNGQILNLIIYTRRSLKTLTAFLIDDSGIGKSVIPTFLKIGGRRMKKYIKGSIFYYAPHKPF